MFRAIALAFAVLAAAALPAQADPHPGQSVNVAIIDGTSVINGGSFPTTTTGPTGAFTDFTFTDVPVANVSAATLASFDTVLLNVASPGMGCNVDTLSAAQQTDLANFLNGGGKLIIYDSECPPQDYSWLPRPFATSNPGALGGTGTVNIVEQSLLGTDTPGDPHFIDEQLLGQSTDAVGDMNVLTTQDPNICLQMSGTNAASQSGATHVYYQSGSGLLIYNGFDVDFMSTSTSPDAADPAGNIAKVWLQELQQPLNGQGLQCAAAVVGISLSPRTATNPVGTSHTVTATRRDQAGNPVPGELISFQVSGTHQGATGTCAPPDCVTDANGQVTFTYTGTAPGEDQIVACFTPAPSGGGGTRGTVAPTPVCSAPATKTWTGAAEPLCDFPITGKAERGTEGDDTITGTAQSDALRGAKGNDGIDGLDSADCLFGNRGKDTINGDEGGDVVRAGRGKDTVNGDDGDDDIRLQDGADTAKAGAGDDTVKAQGERRAPGGVDKVNCGSGDDRAVVDRWDKVSKNCERVRVVN